MKLKKWENPNLTSLDLSETKSDTFDMPHLWQCPTCKKTSVHVGSHPGESPDKAYCDQCHRELTEDDYIGFGPHPS